LATVLVDTGSRADGYFFEELKSTGNMELRLDRRGRARPSAARAEKVQASRELTWTLAVFLPTRPMPGP
ncbi:hypothetical protein ACWELY_29420, partial [Streptomyces sp. NPDC004599]